MGEPRSPRARHLSIVREVDRNPVVARHLAYCAQNQRRSGNTVALKRAAIASLTGWLVDMYGGEPSDPDLLLGVDLPDLLAWQRALSLRLAENSLACYTAAVRALYAWCAGRASGRLLDDNPADELPVVSTRRGPPHPIDDDDLRMALECSRSEPEMHAMLMAGAGLALRCQGIAQMDKRCVVRWDDAAETVLIKLVKKGGKPISLEGSAPVYQALQPYRHVAGPWFTMRCAATGRRKRATPKEISRRIGRYLRSLGIDATAHELRHWALTVAYRARRDLLAVKEFAGHASLQQTVGYVQLVDGAGAQTGHDVGRALTAVMAGQPSLPSDGGATRRRVIRELMQAREQDQVEEAAS